MSSIAKPALGPLRLLARRRRGGVLEWVCGGFLLVVVLLAVFAPVIAPYDPSEVDVLSFNASASGAHLLGTDSAGRDLLSRLIWGARLSLLGPAVVVVVSSVLGTGLALLAAWRGGWVDAAVSRVFDIVFAFPGLLLAIIAVAMFGTGLVAPVVALSISYTPWIGRVVRAAAISQRNLPYIAAASIQGYSGVLICWRHLLPNVLPIVLVQATLAFGYTLVDLASLSFLGLGTQPPTAEWGLMVSNGQASIIEGYPAESLYAGAAIVATIVAVNLLGERLGSRFGIGAAT